MSIDFHLDATTAVITLNRPERLNAIDADHYRALSDAWIRVRDDRNIRVAVTGAGDRSFTVGPISRTSLEARPTWRTS